MAGKSLHIRIAEELIETHELTTEKLWKPWTHSGSSGFDFDLSDELRKILQRKVRSLKYHTLASLIWHAKNVNLYRVHSSTWLNPLSDGRNLMRVIAATVLASTLMDLVPKPEHELELAAA